MFSLKKRLQIRIVLQMGDSASTPEQSMALPSRQMAPKAWRLRTKPQEYGHETATAVRNLAHTTGHGFSAPTKPAGGFTAKQY